MNYPDSSPATCLQEFSSSETQRLNSLYQAQDSALIKMDNGPLFLPGQSDRVVLLVHGFIASPFELAALARIINQSGKGPTVYLPLLQGFGSSTAIANQSRLEDWKNTVTAALERLGQQFKYIALAGFSLGGGLISDLILNRRHVSHEGLVIDSPLNSRICSLILMAPYYGMYIPVPLSTRTLSWISSNLLRRKYGINLKAMYALGRIRDLKTVVDHPGFYNTAFPVAAVGQICEYEKQLQKFDKQLVMRIPTLLAYSESDQTVNLELAKQWVHAHYPGAETLRLLKNHKIPHQFVAPDVNPDHFDSISRSISDFVLRHF